MHIGVYSQVHEQIIIKSLPQSCSKEGNFKAGHCAICKSDNFTIYVYSKTVKKGAAPIQCMDVHIKAERS